MEAGAADNGLFEFCCVIFPKDTRVCELLHEPGALHPYRLMVDRVMDFAHG